MKKQKNRISYPFINCTNCGPRFTIIQDLPYDREKSTMKKFRLCAGCRKEYEDISDRRFHAQPIACLNCGPKYELVNQTSGNRIAQIAQIIDTVADLIRTGKIVAIKGLGGFFIACDAMNEKTVSRLRHLKVREGKPFAVMFANINELKKFVEINESEEKNLLSWRRPIVILKEIKDIATCWRSSSD
ncbi:MAG: Sua5/YciO/YrdC/YwlC family protein [Bacteroidia bacterium]|nr:Sua5/YciO/YrdC/YwlC family protein [Bacteroidia bacterium]